MIVLLFLILFMFTSLRPGLGGWDYKNYETFFNQIPDLFNIEFDFLFFHYEPLYTLANSFVKLFTDNFVVFIVIYTFLTHLLMFQVIKKYSINFFYSIFIYFSTYYLWHNFTLLRQNVAILIFWFSLEYIREKKFVKYLLLIIIASLFHNSAIVLILFYFIIELMDKFSIKKNVWLFIFLSLLKPASDFLLRYIYKILSYFNIGRSNLEAYLSSTERGVNEFFILEVLLIIVFVYLKRNDSLIKNNKLFVNLLLLSFVIVVWFSNYEIAVRFVEYFRIYYFVLIPILIKTIKNIYLKYSLFFITIFYFLFRLYRYLNTFDSGSLKNYVLF